MAMRLFLLVSSLNMLLALTKSIDNGTESTLDADHTNYSWDSQSNEAYLKKLKTAYTALYIVCGVFFVLSIPYCCGFRTGGVLGGSAAAGIHSGIGDVSSGSLFACCQCIGTTCLGTCLSVFIFIASGVSSLVIFILHVFASRSQDGAVI